MTSTEFTVGIGEGNRVSSKVLKPPGGGSSDIFGVGSASGAKSSSEKSSDTNTHSRLFGKTSDLPPIPTKKNTLHQSSIFDKSEQAPIVNTRGKKHYVRRNPITGEEIDMELENLEISDREVKGDNKEVKVEEAVTAPSKTVQTSIRVRNPPGGKSSGIF